MNKLRKGKNVSVAVTLILCILLTTTFIIHGEVGVSYAREYLMSSDSKTLEVKMDKVILNVDKGGNAVVTGGKNTLVGKLLASKGKVKINSPLLKREFTIKPE